MTYALLELAHVIGAILIGAGLMGVWLADLRSRQVRGLTAFAEAVRNIGVFYDGLVVPGALLLMISGSWMIVQFFGWEFVKFPWLLGMVGLFAFEFVEGNTVTRLYFMRLRRLTRDALRKGAITPELGKARAEGVPTFTHFLDLPILFLIVALGVLKPTDWRLFIAGAIVAVAVATAMTLYVPRLYPWGEAAAANAVDDRGGPRSAVLPGEGKGDLPQR